MEKNILVVDDDNLVNEFVTETLKRLNYSVSSATSGAEALEMIESRDFDLVLSDVRMPEMDGITLLEKNQIDHSRYSSRDSDRVRHCRKRRQCHEKRRL